MAGLVKAIDKKVADNKEKKVASVINFTGDATDEYLESIKAFAKKHNLKNVAVTTTADANRFKVNEDASVTVMHYLKKKVAYNFATDSKVTKKDVASVLKGAEKILE